MSEELKELLKMNPLCPVLDSTGLFLVVFIVSITPVPSLLPALLQSSYCMLCSGVNPCAFLKLLTQGSMGLDSCDAWCQN